MDMISTHLTGRKLYTLVILHMQDEHKVLLGLKKRGLGVGKWNGFGGKVEPGETIEEGAIREMQEESSVLTPQLEKAGIVFNVLAGNPIANEIHVFRATAFSGTPGESDEMIPCWFPIAEIPFEQMWIEARIWWPYFFTGKPFVGVFQFSESKIENYTLEYVETLPSSIEFRD
ncbi:NUDIX hydrolase domain-like protein [Jimgerdemannia flammicorona]|uniref:NUDIX hydrolase domain-like protein n=2 Tax=Jimgerdemannia flammicorona TaxID=994334 RepID=A0A433QIS6_9FUNG|nr:NUDIX hydrolase domain-like protein [Jimgerdemannia flammicorona]RUS29730.1 NUDIX hydrolase domain-like protein [Jimgerdemannia flammicorona]